MLCMVLLELLRVEAELFVPLHLRNALSIVRRVNRVAIVWAVPDVVAFYLAAVADVVGRQLVNHTR